MNPHHQKIDSLQALRALAAIFVMLYHGTTIIYKNLGYTYLNNFFKVGFMGVDVFFVLSGFIIFYTSSPIQFNRANFLKKRFIRIFPIYWLVIIALIIAHLIVPTPGEPEYNATRIIASFTLYPLFPNNLYVLGIAWTLTYEIIFYVVFAFTWSMGVKWFYYTFIGWAIIILFTYLLSINTSIFAINALIDPVILNFGFGCILAYLFQNFKTIKHWKWIVATGGIFLIITLLTYYFGTENNAILFSSPLSRVYLFGLPSAILIFGLLYYNKPVPKLLVAIGDASYSLYLIHAAVIALILKVIFKFHGVKGLDNAVVITLVFVLTIGVSLVFYKFVERPLIKLLNKLLL